MNTKILIIFLDDNLTITKFFFTSADINLHSLTIALTFLTTVILSFKIMIIIFIQTNRLMTIDPKRGLTCEDPLDDIN